MHANSNDGGKFVTPRIAKKAEGKIPEVCVNLGSSNLARAIAYMIEAMNAFKPDSNPLANVTHRKNAPSVIEALSKGTGKPSDIFTYAAPLDLAEDKRTNYGEAANWRVIYEVTREDILRMAQSFVTSDDLLKPVESKVNELAKSLRFNVKTVGERPTYGATSTGRAKKSASTFTV